MSTLTKTILPVMAAEMNGTSTLPLLYDIGRPNPDYEGPDSVLGDDDGLWLGYSGVTSAFPYQTQDNYSHAVPREGLDCYVLENEHLRAIFVPEAGGKLWSLFDKDAGRELLFANHVYRPAYLALRNAWASGGVEWNCGATVGHHPYTCETIFTATLSSEQSGIGCPVLRFYSYERIRAVTHQMDFYLPSDARFLHCRMRVVNDSQRETGMYWWSNIAVPSDPAARCVVPADGAYTPLAGGIGCVSVPEFNNVDITYPTNNPVAVDYFFKTYENHRYYTSHLGADGYGLVQTSTSRLKGRKLFVWGRGQGGAKWQEFLSGDDGRGNYNAGSYCEIQCGLAHTQYEILPMPPKTAWEWIEYYGPMQADPEKIHGDWHGAQAEVEARFDEMAPLCEMEKELIDTKAMALTAVPAEIFGEGWAALENLRRDKRGKPHLCPHLDFGEIGEEQRMWANLLRTGSLNTMDDDDAVAPISYQRRWEWRRLLEVAAKGPDLYYWKTHYMLACAYMAEGEIEDAEKALERSALCHVNAWNTYARAELLRIKGDTCAAAQTMLSAAGMAPGDDSLCKMTARMLANAGMWDVLSEFTESRTERQKALPRIRYYRALAAERLNQLALAETLLYADGGLQIPDIQEGEVSITNLWFDLEEKKAKRDGRPFDREKAKPPKFFDFRMFVVD
ncbi:MAG: DUF5107 domain-containing protein [Clostridia bacterium]|nr:DUF5107 domain-containing protein [Clostridia bacterium]